MNGGFEYFDIILFAMIAAFLVYRLGSALGKRTGHERQADPFESVPGRGPKGAESGNDNVVAMPSRGDEAPDGVEKEPDTPLGAAITQIKLADPKFSRETFLQGARAAFEMIITAYALGDMKTLKSLLSGEVYANFEAAVAARERSGRTQETNLVGIDSAELLEARLDGSDAIITVKYQSQQVNATRDESGKVLEGDPNKVEEVTDFWTFSRDLRASDPNWSLIGTASPN
jgi:predicted lipid-binding transport protein (Tim44 family)